MTVDTKTSTSSRARFVASATLLTLGLGGIVLGFGLAARESTASNTTDSDASNNARAPRAAFSKNAGEGLPCTFAPGTQMAYEVETHTHVELDFGQLAGELEDALSDEGGQMQVGEDEAKIHDVERAWHLDLVALRSEDDSATIFAARIRDRGIIVDASEGGPAPQAAENIDDTFLIRVDGRCGIREFGWRTEGDLDVARQQQLMSAGLGFWAPSSMAEASRYTGTSFDATGRYDAIYAFEDDGTLTGEIQSFAQDPAMMTARSSFSPVSMAIVDSTITAELSLSSWFERLTNARELEMLLGGEPFGSHLRETKARRGEFEDFQPQVDLSDGGWSWGRVPSATPDSSERFDPELVGAPLSNVLATYRELLASGAGVGDYGALLRDWLRANPGQTGALIALLEGGEFEGESYARAGIFYALGTANTEAAKDGLLGLLRESGIKNQIAAAHAISMVDQPHEEMLDLLAAGSRREDIHAMERGTLALALGSVAQHTELSDPAMAARARGTIQGWLDEPSDEEHLRHALSAAGNAGHDALGESVARHLDHEDPKIRDTATRAMRQMSAEEAFPRLSAPMQDEDRVVRTSAFETATAVARSHDIAPSELVAFAGNSLVAEAPAERRAAMNLLGEAARHGDERASVILDEHLQAQLDSDAVDAKELAAIGRNMKRRWVAKN